MPRDLSGREIGILIPLALAVVVIGVAPGRLLRTFREPAAQLMEEVKLGESEGAEVGAGLLTDAEGSGRGW